MLTAARWLLSLEELGPDDSCGIIEELEQAEDPSSVLTVVHRYKPGDHDVDHVVTTWQRVCVLLMRGLKFFFIVEGPIIRKEIPGKCAPPYY